jgi:rhodanese-related sulfurtransferase
MLNRIGFFQLDNLISNRVPFLFYNMSQSIAPWYTSVSKMHVENYEKLMPVSEIKLHIESQKAPKDYAIVLLCNDGKQSLEIYNQLAAASYTNVYVVNGGYRQIVTERTQI